jgi:hypothetical protein
MKFEIDNYSVKARLYPCLLILLPAFIVGVYYITDLEKYYHYFTAVLAFGLFTFVLAQFGRDKGKSKEPELYKYFGGKPTTQILRYRNTYLDSVTKNRYRQILTQKIPDIQMPTAQEENDKPDDADEVYNSCAKFLISKTRDTTKFNLLFKENVSYGFRRNLWAMKNFALSIIFLCLVTHFYFTTEGFKVFNKFTTQSIGLFAFLLITILTWLFVITRDWIKLVAFSYAERLFETLNEV